jgi:uncharacterized protein (DUF1800 family)
METRLLVTAAAAAAFLSFQSPLTAATHTHAAVPLTLNTSTNGNKTVTWPRLLLPALETNRLATGTNVAALVPVLQDALGVATNGYTFSTSNNLPHQFFSLTLGQMSSNDLLTANALNRLAYGPTPDELERVRAIGPQAYIDEQLNPQNIPYNLDSYVSATTNSASGPGSPGWVTCSATGQVSANVLYIYLTGAGQAFIDDVSVQMILSNAVFTTNLVVTNIGGMDVTNEVITTSYPASGAFLGPNLLVNGDFELPFANGWSKTANFAASDVELASPPCSGTNALHIVASAAGSGSGNSISQGAIAGLTNGQRCVIRFAYLPRPGSGSQRVYLRLSGGGTAVTDNDPAPAPTWFYAQTTGRATATPTFYLYLNGSGEVYIDEMKLVAGSVAGAGPNLLRNPDFEEPLGTNWFPSADFTNSVVSTSRAYSGSGSLRLIATAGGGGQGDSLSQSNIVGLVNNQTYTLSFWYTIPTGGRLLTARLSGSQLQAVVPDTSIGNIKRRLDSLALPSPDNGRVTLGTLGGAFLHDLRAWYLQNCVGSPRQLLEVLTQFLENHFVTEHAKSRDYFDRYYDDGNLMDIHATDLEYREITGWRNALLNTNCTFYDLLKVHAESPAQIIYLDTVDSRADGNNIANENYARELFELYCMGVDNGYDQLDITAMSRAWTGWTLNIVDRGNENNPFATQSTTLGLYPTTSGTGISNIVGVWAFSYNSSRHGTNRAPFLSVWTPGSTRTAYTAMTAKVYPPRMGPVWAGKPYQISLPRRTGAASIDDGYDVIRALSTNLFTAEYLSVKLCRLFVHDDFPNPTTMTNLEEYAFYNYSNPNRSAEAELVRRCMVAWDTPAADGRKGNIRKVLKCIFDSDLFRSHGGSLQKVKTPVEYCVSAIRALRAANTNGTFTASSDGYSISGRSGGASSSPLIRQGNMKLFDRDAPDGYPEDGAPWISAGTLAERVRFVQTFLMTPGGAKDDGISGGNFNLSDPVTLILLNPVKIPAGSRNNAGVVADYFLSILYPGEGKANLDLYRKLAIDYLNTADTGGPVGGSPFSLLVLGTAGYDTRVRSTVAMLMTLPRFNEQ